jgi:hypothetical protein
VKGVKVRVSIILKSASGNPGWVNAAPLPGAFCQLDLSEAESCAKPRG